MIKLRGGIKKIKAKKKLSGHINFTSIEKLVVENHGAAPFFHEIIAMMILCSKKSGRGELY